MDKLKEATQALAATLLQCSLGAQTGATLDIPTRAVHLEIPVVLLDAIDAYAEDQGVSREWALLLTAGFDLLDAKRG